MKMSDGRMDVTDIHAFVVRQSSTGYIFGFVLQEPGGQFLPVVNEQPGCMEITDLDTMLDLDQPADTMPEAAERVQDRAEQAWFRDE